VICDSETWKDSKERIRTISDFIIIRVLIRALLVQSQGLPHGRLLLEPLLVEQLGSQTKALLSELRDLVYFSGLALSVSLHLVHAHTEALLVSFHMFMLRLIYKANRNV
jgi:hypothetical protein